MSDTFNNSGFSNWKLGHTVAEAGKNIQEYAKMGFGLM